MFKKAVILLVLLLCGITSIYLLKHNNSDKLESFEVISGNVYNVLNVDGSDEEFALNYINNNFSYIQRLDIINLANELGIDNFNLDDSGFYTSSPHQRTSIIPNVYLEPISYYAIDVDAETGAVLVSSDVDLFKENIPISFQRLLSTIYNYTLYNEGEPFAGFQSYDCNGLPFCDFQIASNDAYTQTSFENYSFRLYDIIQILQASYNTNNTFMKLYPQYNLFLTSDSIYFDTLNELGILYEFYESPPLLDHSNLDYDTYRINISRNNVFNSDINKEFLNNIKAYLPSDFSYAYNNYNSYYYWHFYKTDTGFSIRAGEYDFDDMADYLSDEYPNMYEFKELSGYGVDDCEYNASEVNESTGVVTSCDTNYIFFD